MYKSIQVEDFDISSFSGVTYEEINNYKKNKNEKIINIQDYLLDKNNRLSVDKIADNLFLDVNPDIFLSHSHADEKDVIRLAVLIEKKLNLNVFVDSCVWGNAFELLRKIDEEYSYNLTKKTFNYHTRNQTTSNIFMILNAALHRVIDNCETFIFLGTDNSISITDAFNDEKYISSPWIYSELQFAKLVRRTKPRQISLESRKEVIAKSEAFDSAIEFAYSIPTTDAKLRNLRLNQWINTAMPLIEGQVNHPLDDLYKRIVH